MIDEPQIVRTVVQPTAVIRINIGRAQMREVMGPAKAELKSVLDEQGVKSVGPMFTHHFRMVPGIFDFEVGLPVGTPVSPDRRVVSSQLPACTVARTLYKGSYEGLGAAWGEFDRWIEGHQYNAGPSLWEIYTVGGESGGDASLYCTELIRPLMIS